MLKTLKKNKSKTGKKMNFMIQWRDFFMKKEIQQLILESLFLSVSAKKKLLEKLDSLSDNQAKVMLSLLETAQKHQNFLIEKATQDKQFLANIKHDIQQEKRHDDQIREEINQTKEAQVLEKLEAEIDKL